MTLFNIHDAEHSDEDSDIWSVSSKVFSNSEDSNIHIVSRKASSDSEVDSDIQEVFTMAPPRGSKGKITDYFRPVSTSRINDFPQFLGTIILRECFAISITEKELLSVGAYVHKKDHKCSG